MYNARIAAAYERSGIRYAKHYGHIADNVIIYDDGTVAAAIEWVGFPSDLAGNAANNAGHSIHSEVFRNISDEDVTVFDHLIQHDRVEPFPAEVHPEAHYGRMLWEDYHRVCLDGLRSATWVTTILVRPRSTLTGWRAALGLQPKAGDFSKLREDSTARHRRVERLEDKVRTMIRSLQGFGPRRLGVRVAGGVVFSEIAEAHRLALYCKWAPIPMVEATSGGMGASIYSDRVICSNACFRVELPGREDDEKPHGTMIGLRIYPTRWRDGMFDGLIGQSFNFVMTNSYFFEGRTKAGDKLSTRVRHMENAGDRANSLREELDETMDAVDRGEHVMGGHLWSMAVHAHNFASLENAVTEARTALAGAGVVIAAEDVGMEAAYWAQLPGSPRYLRAREGGLPSVAYAAFSSLHSHPKGDTQHYWGRPLYRARTIANTATDVPWHVRDVGNRVRIAPVGRGKTLDMAFETVMLDPIIRELGGCQIFFDKDSSSETLVRAMGGPVAQLRAGEDSGAAPLLALPNTPSARAWIHEFLTGLILDDGRGSLTPDDDDRMARGVNFVMAQPAELRREVGAIAAVRQFMLHEDPLSGGARLERWCRGGPFGWAFDGQEDDVRFGDALSSVDPTALLNNTTVMPPMAAYLLHRVGMVVGSAPVVLHADEFRSFLPDIRTVNGVQFQRFGRGFEDVALTGRKKQLSLDIATQQPEHILTHPVGPSIMAQCATRVFYPNPDADRHWYIEGMGCSHRIWEAVRRDMLTGPHSKIIQREGIAVRVVLDLLPIAKHIPILSTNNRTLPVLHEAIGDYGHRPEDWLPHFWQRLQEKGLL
jgi:type IV secretion system protein VirB4